MSYDFDTTAREWGYTMQTLNQQDLDRNFALATTHIVKWMQAARMDYLAKDGVLRLSLHSGKFAVPLGSHADKQTGRMDCVQGRGDGSFISPKFTGIAAFCGSDARHRYNVKVLRAAVHSFGKTAVRWPCVGLQEAPRASHRTGGWCAVL